MLFFPIRIHGTFTKYLLAEQCDNGTDPRDGKCALIVLDCLYGRIGSRRLVRVFEEGEVLG